MKIFLKILKWIGNTLMAFLLVFGLITNHFMNTIHSIAPTGPDDLGIIKITVKSVQDRPNGFFIYPNVLDPSKFLPRFVVTLIPPPANFKTLVQPGQNVFLAINKEAIANIQHEPSLEAYSLILENGETVFDTSQSIPVLTPEKIRAAHNMPYFMIGIPLIYYAAFVLYWMLRRRKTGAVERN